ncbi:hypothetical protein OAY12_01725 [Candidatus Pelagibacter sp.]|nr:hypothetical protein [Candidatus Pelagibacter sp.]
MDEEISIIDKRTRNERIKSFFIENRKKIIFGISTIILFIIVFYSYQIYREGFKEQLSDKYNRTVIDYESGEKSLTSSLLVEVIEDKDSTYSPLALYFILDNNLIDDPNEINDLFDLVINKVDLEKEIKNLIIYKKALYNADNVGENQLLEILNPLVNSQSVWKSHALYLLAEYFYSKNEKEKSKEFFKQILNTENANEDLVKESRKRLTRDLSE